MAYDKVVDSAALDAALTTVADAIRAKNGSSDKYTVAQMGEAVQNIPSRDKIQHPEIPDYVKDEAAELIQKVRAVQNEKTITFLALSDSHYYGRQGSAGVDSSVDSNGTQGNVSNLHSAMGAKSLAYALNLDFVAHLGDMTWGSQTTTSDLLHAQVDELYAYLREAYGDYPQFLCVGNHDSGIYYHNAQIAAGSSGTYTENADWIYSRFTAHAESTDTVIAGKDCGGYCYRDFPGKKLRVFMLNTSEALIKDSVDNCTYGSQRIWFGNALLDLNNKEDATSWSWLMLCHYPADYGGTMPLSELLKAYVDGGSIFITDEKTGQGTTLNFKGKNGAKMIAQFHGHVHNFLVSKLYSYSTGSGKQYDAWRIGIPNAQYNRENYYSTVGNYTDINFSESRSYPKTPGTGDDTSFVVNVINPETQIIHSFAYGAGYDRAIGFGATVYYSISQQLVGCSSSNAATSIEAGQSYSTTIIASDRYDLSDVTVKMGGVDITGTVYSGGKIQIPEVTGNVEIKAIAIKQVSYTNLVPKSIDSSGDVYNGGLGYKNGVCLSSSGAEAGDMGAFTTTGFIPYNPSKNNVLRIGGSAIVANYTEYGWRVQAYNSDFQILQTYNVSGFTNHANIVGGVLVIDSLQTFIGFKPNENAAYIRISCRTGTRSAEVNGAGLIVTLDQEID